MGDSILLAAPLVIGAVVLAVRFVGCSFSPEVPMPYSTEIMTTAGLVSFWRLNETSGTTAHDSTDGNAGTYENGVTLGVPSQVNTDTDNTAAQFDGSSQYVDVPFAANINSVQFTVEAIVDPTAIGAGGTADNHVVVSSRANDAAGSRLGYLLLLEGATFQARVGTGTTVTTVTVPADAVVNGGPYYLAMTFDGTTLTLYVNPTDPFDPANPGETAQQQAAAATTFAPNASAHFVIGATDFPGPGTHAFFPGVINDVAVYDAALDFTTIQSHYMVMMTGYSM